MRASISILLERNEEISADGGGPGRIHRTSRLLTSGGPSNMDTRAWVDGASTVAVSVLRGSATSITPSTELMVRCCGGQSSSMWDERDQRSIYAFVRRPKGGASGCTPRHPGGVMRWPPATRSLL